MMLTFAGVFLAVVNIQMSTALRWTSVRDLPANSTVQACVGDNVTLLWKYDTDADEHVVDVEWQFQPKGQAEVTIASYIRGSFLVSPTAVQHVHFVPNAGLQVVHVTQQDSGTYSVRTNVNLHGSIVGHSQRVLMEDLFLKINAEDNLHLIRIWFITLQDAPSTSDGALHVQLMPGAVQNSVTGEWHVRLSCGTFTKLGQPPVSVVWTTPANETIPSSYYDDLSNKYILVVDNPVASGQYTCRLERTPSEMCLAVDSPLRHGASVHVDGAEARLSVCSAQLLALRVEISELKSENANLTDQLSELISELANIQGQAEELIASYVRGNFLLAPTAKQQHVQFVPNAGLELMHVTKEDSGAYILNVNINLHGSTPDNVTVSSSYYDNAGNYILIVDNPVATGEYSCRLEQTPSAMCLPAQSLLLNGASIHVDGVDTRLSVLEGQLVALQNENAELQHENMEMKSELNRQQKENENNTAVLEGQLTAVQQQLASLPDGKLILDVLTSALQWTSALDLPANVTVHACTGDNLTLPWKFETEAAEHSIYVEWLYQAE
ncbi:hypothetical protein BaRGS_00017713, partial [Batillaria attramentaria]